MNISVFDSRGNLKPLDDATYDALPAPSKALYDKLAKAVDDNTNAEIASREAQAAMAECAARLAVARTKAMRQKSGDQVEAARRWIATQRLIAEGKIPVGRRE